MAPTCSERLYWSARGHVLCETHLDEIDDESRAAERWATIPLHRGQRKVKYQCERCRNGSPVVRRQKHVDAGQAGPRRPSVTGGDKMTSAPGLVEMRWSLRSPRGQALRCELHRAESGVELRSTWKGALLRSERVPTIEAAREIADAWRRRLMAGGSLEQEPSNNEAP